MHTLSALQIKKLFDTKKVSALDITSHFLERAEKFNPELGAFLEIHAGFAKEQAKLIDEKKAKGLPLGKLAGIPVAIKDNIHIKGKKTTCASKFLENYTALFDATVVERIKSHDGILFGKTNMDEFAMGSSSEKSAYFPVQNPWNIDCTPGGSSGGSAAAVSARLAPLALGSDTGGSIRQPAAFTGIVGFKPTYGRVSRYGLVAFGSSFDQIGPFATCVEDIALMMEVIGGSCKHDSTSLQEANPSYLDELDTSIAGKKIGVHYEGIEALNEEGKRLFLKSIEQLKAMGAEVIDIKMDLLKKSVALYYILSTAEASTNLARFDGISFSKRSEKATTLEEVYELSRHDGFGPEVRRRILLGTYILSAGYQDAFYRKAQKVRRLMIEEFQKAFEECDAIVMPTTATSAFKLGSIQDPLQMYLQDLFTLNANLTGMPAISLPCGFDSSSLPYSIQFIGPQREDARVLRFARQFEKQLGLSQNTPHRYK